MLDKRDDQNRLLIATFIVATTIAIMFAQVHVPVAQPKDSWIVMVIAALLWGLITSALFAFLFILAKGYELRYKTKKEALRFPDKYNYVLYNLSVWVYVPMVIVLLAGYLLKLLNGMARTGNVWASIGVYVLVVVVALGFNYKSIISLLKAVKK